MVLLHISNETWNVLLVLLGIVIGATIVYLILRPNKPAKEIIKDESSQLLTTLLNEKRMVLAESKFDISKVLESWDTLTYVPDNLNYILLHCDQYFMGSNNYDAFKKLIIKCRNINSSSPKDDINNKDLDLKQCYSDAETLISNELNRTITELKNLIK